MALPTGRPALASRRQDEVGRFLSDHDSRSIGVACRKVGHDRSVGNTQSRQMEPNASPTTKSDLSEDFLEGAAAIAQFLFRSTSRRHIRLTTGFAVDAVLRIDDEFERVGFSGPLVETAGPCCLSCCCQ
jgi:hypothetical protein